MKYQINTHLRKNVSLILIVFFSFQVCYCQHTKWSLEKCIAYAQDNNLQIKQLSYNADIAQINLNSANNAYLPVVNAGINHKHYLDRTVNPYNRSYSNDNRSIGTVSVSAGIDVFQGFKRKHNKQQNEFSLTAVLMDIEEARNNISLNITSVFLELLFYDELINSNTILLNETKEQISMAKELVNSGIKTESYLYEFLTQLAQDSVNLIMAKNNYQSTLIDLVQLLDINDPIGFEIDKPDVLPLQETSNASVDDYFAIALSTLPQFKSVQFRQKAAESNIKYFMGYKYPSLSFETYVGSHYSSNNSLFNNMGEAINYPYHHQLNDNVNMYVGLNLSIPIFNKFSVRNSVDLAKISKYKADVNVELVQQQIYNDVQRAYYDLIAAREKMHLMQVLLDATNLSYIHAVEKLKAGVISVYDYSIVNTKLSKTTSDYLQSKYEYIFKTKILDFYTGIPITLEN